MMTLFPITNIILATVLCGILTVSPALAQTTAFTYQGRLAVGGAVAAGIYEMQFRLFDTPEIETGGQQGGTITNQTVQVTNGIFTVSLDFGSAVFASGADLYLDISIRPGGSSGSYTPLDPRSRLASTPYAIRALNAGQLGGVPASEYVQTTANVLNVTTQYNIQGQRILSDAGTNNLFAGVNAGTTNSTGSANAFFGRNSGAANSTGSSNSFFGYNSGAATTSGRNNSFVGDAAGFNNTTADNNTFVGFLSGFLNTTGAGNAFYGSSAGQNNNSGGSNSFFGFVAGLNNLASDNSFFGRGAGFTNTTGTHNSFFGRNASDFNSTGNDNSSFGFNAGKSNTTGNRNVFFGSAAGFANTTGSNLTMVGASADVSQNNLQNATAVGANAAVSQSNSLVLGGINGTNGATADTNVGIGTSAPAARLHVKTNTGNMLLGDSGCGGLYSGLGFGTSLTCNNYSMLGDGTSTWINRATGGHIYFREGNNDQVIIKPGGVVYLGSLGAAGTPQSTLCRNTSLEIAFCSSSRRYKTDIEPYGAGMNIISRLRPVNFKWLASGQRDLGLIAEEVAEVEPLLAFRNNEGEIEGVSYSQLSVVLINAAREQQKQIEELREQNRSLLLQLGALKRLVCLENQTAEVCREH